MAAFITIDQSPRSKEDSSHFNTIKVVDSAFLQFANFDHAFYLRVACGHAMWTHNVSHNVSVTFSSSYKAS